MKSLVFVMFMVIFPTIIASADLIETTCQKTPYYNLCVATLKSNPQSSKANVQGLAHIAADELQARGTDTLNQIKGLLKHARDVQLEMALKSCVDAYYMIVNVDMPEALEAITKGNPKFAQDAASYVVKEADECGKSLVGSTLISSNNKFVHDLSVIVVSIVKTLL